MAKIPAGTARTERISLSVTPDVRDAVSAAARDLGVSVNSWLAIAVGRAVRSHRMEREVLEKVLLETLGEQLKMQLEEMELANGQP